MSSTPPLQQAFTPQLRGINIGVGVMAAVFVFLRFFARWQRQLKLGVDDYLMIVSLLLLVCGITNNAIAIENGLGITWSALPSDRLQIVTKCLFAYQFIYLISISVIKIAILMTYYRIFDNRRFRISLYIMIAIIVGWCISFVIVYMFACLPIYSHWDFSVPGECLNLESIFAVNAVTNILTDLIILCLPIRQVWKLQMMPYQRVSLTILFLLGGVVVFTSAYRISTLFLINRYDQTYSTAPVLIWSHIEYCAAMVGASLPILRPLLDLFLHKTGIRVRRDSESTPNTWKFGLATIGSEGRNRRLQSNTIQDTEHTTDKEDNWTPAANVSREAVPLPLKEPSKVEVAEETDVGSNEVVLRLS